MKKSQSSTEKAVFIVCIILALLAGRAYVKRGFSAKIKQNVDSLANQFDPANGNYSKGSTQKGDISYATKFTDTYNATGKTSSELKNQWISDFIAAYNAANGQNPDCLQSDGTTPAEDCNDDSAVYIRHDTGGNYTTIPSGDRIYPIACQAVGNAEVTDPLCLEAMDSTSSNSPMSSVAIEGAYNVTMKRFEMK